MRLLTEGDIPSDDLMLQDLRAGAIELGILPSNREEVLWLRKLRQPVYSAFWSQLQEALPRLDQETRLGLELRHLPIIVSAALHDRVDRASHADKKHGQPLEPSGAFAQRVGVDRPVMPYVSHDVQA